RFGPKGLEGIDEDLVLAIERTKVQEQNLRFLPEGKGWLLVEFGDTEREVAEQQAHRMASALQALGSKAPAIRFYDDPADEAAVWKIRESGLGATAKVPGQADTYEGWEDSAVPPERAGEYLRKLRSLLGRFGYRCALYGHFGQGCIHTRIDFDLQTREGVRKYRHFAREAAELVVSMGGSLSGEHGDGQSRGELLPLMFGREMVQGFGEFKAIWDPAGKMNPGKVVDPYPMTENLRLGPSYHPPEPKTHFAFKDDRFSFARAANRCVGVGNCRQEKGGTMCPSYMATREEKHSTRGRARLLFEMLQGNPLAGLWQSKDVREALDLCLSCKGCKGECPVHVDMATYKAEFYAHHYAGRLRPRHMYAFGCIPWWSRVAGRVPRLFNSLTQTPGLAEIAKWAAGVHRSRRLPALAPEPFHRWFARRRPLARQAHGATRGKVLLWADTFNNYFMPHTAQAAVEVLEAAGFEVEIPARPFCCGRPLYDYGFVEAGRGLLTKILDQLAETIRAGRPVVFLEPSCCTVLRDELVELFATDPRAQQLAKQAFMLGEFLTTFAPDWRPPRLDRRAIVHGHCHHKAVLKMKGETALLDAVFGDRFQILDTTCCGMAGAFGFERDHYDVSLKLAEHVLLPAIREAPSDTLIVTDGFSCREQIMQTSDRRAFHLAEVLQLAIRFGMDAPRAFPEQQILPPRQGGLGWRSMVAAGLLLVSGAIAVAIM
ncbi:MAG: FAD-binding oxidoreductase, partial [Cyanobacteria bacterium REEB65]|nr:FAD-binding oxidoreductase [Cyanobacteria bacterium REEB65]